MSYVLIVTKDGKFLDVDKFPVITQEIKKTNTFNGILRFTTTFNNKDEVIQALCNFDSKYKSFIGGDLEIIKKNSKMCYHSFIYIIYSICT